MSGERRRRRSRRRGVPLTLERDGDAAIIIRPWRDAKARTIAGTLALLLPLLALMVALDDGEAVPRWLSFVVIAGALGYPALALWFNATRIRVDDRRLTVRHGPFWWPGGGAWPVDDVVAIEVQRREIVAVKRGMETRGTVFDLVASLRGTGGRTSRVDLVRGTTNGRQVMDLRTVLEGVLGFEGPAPEAVHP